MTEKDYGYGWADGGPGAWELIWDLYSKQIPCVFMRTEYGPTVIALNYEDVSDEKNKFMESIKGDFNQWWATAKYPEFASCWLDEHGGTNYWWSFD